MLIKKLLKSLMFLTALCLTVHGWASEVEKTVINLNALGAKTNSTEIDFSQTLAIVAENVLDKHQDIVPDISPMAPAPIARVAAHFRRRAPGPASNRDFPRGFP